MLKQFFFSDPELRCSEGADPPPTPGFLRGDDDNDNNDDDDDDNNDNNAGAGRQEARDLVPGVRSHHLGQRGGRHRHPGVSDNDDDERPASIFHFLFLSPALSCSI